MLSNTWVWSLCWKRGGLNCPREGKNGKEIYRKEVVRISHEVNKEWLVIFSVKQNPRSSVEKEGIRVGLGF